MLSIRRNKFRPLRMMTWMYSRCCSLSDVSASSCAMPITPFIGVRISWLMSERKSDFAVVARSARSSASFSS